MNKSVRVNCVYIFLCVSRHRPYPSPAGASRPSHEVSALNNSLGKHGADEDADDKVDDVPDA